MVQSPATMKLGLMVVMGVLAFLLLLVILFKFQLSRSRKKQRDHDQELTNKQSLLNDFKVGMLHVNVSGEILFANQAAAFF